MSHDNNVTVFVKIINNSQIPNKPYCLNLSNNLSDIREKLGKFISDIDILLFSKKENDDYVVTIEEDFSLKEIVEIINETNSKRYQLYLMNIGNILKDKFKLDHGRVTGPDGIKEAKKRAFIMKDYELNKIGASGYEKGFLEFESGEDRMKKNNFFFNVDGINVHNFVNFGLSVENSKNKNVNEEINSTCRYTQIAKVSLKFDKENLVLTDDFKNDVINAIQSKDHKKFRKITEEYGEFIPTEVIFGGKVYFKDTKVLSKSSSDKIKGFSLGLTNLKIGFNSSDSKKKSNLSNSECIGFLGGKHPNDENFDEKNWIESLEDYQNWDCIQFKNSINIFQLLSGDLYKESFKFIGKKILYTDTKDCKYNLYGAGTYRIFELNDDNTPSHILKIIQNKDADCDIFASVINTEDSEGIFFNCQVVRANDNISNEKPSIIIHCIQKEFRKCEYKLKIKIMVIGYDIDFFSNISVELKRKEYNSQNQREYDSIILQPLEHTNLVEKNSPFFGIPILSNFNSNIIGQKSDNGLKIYTFSYSSKENRYVQLPNFTFCTFIVLNNYNDRTKVFPFNSKFIDLKEIQSKNLDPKWVSLYLPKDSDYNPIFYNQKRKKIKINYANCKCNEACFICENKQSKISKEDNAIFIVYSSR